MNDIALIGLGVMGQSLARNLASRKIKTVVYNRTLEKSKKYIEAHGNDCLSYEKDLKSLVLSLKSPRKIILMVPAGAVVDEMIKRLTPLLNKGDLLIDAGNSYFRDTIQRGDRLHQKGIHWVGLGVSGGEEGALHGPSLMPGCELDIWKKLKPILEKIAARDFNGRPCVTHVGTDGAGHYVKMVHNGIEYAVMQLMAEAYDMLKRIYDLNADQTAAIFDDYRKGPLQSYLFDIAVPVLRQKDEFRKGNLIDYILDKAGQKGTGRWTAIDGLERGAVIPAIAESVFARGISSFKEQRITLGKAYKKPLLTPKVSLKNFKKSLEHALYAAMITVYAQGFDLIRLAAKEQGWKIDFAELARIWQGGCIIRADLLSFLHQAFLKNKNSPHLLAIKEIQKTMMSHLNDFRQVASMGHLHGVPGPAFAATLSYFEAMTSEHLPANFIQGLRDFFGAHTYERIDKKGIFHTEWNDLT